MHQHAVALTSSVKSVVVVESILARRVRGRARGPCICMHVVAHDGHTSSVRNNGTYVGATTVDMPHRTAVVSHSSSQFTLFLPARSTCLIVAFGRCVLDSSPVPTARAL
jgi:hypothetical protein